MKGHRPYPEYRDSGVEWLGKVPITWEVKPLKRVFRVVNGSTPKSGEPEYWDGDIPWATPEDLGALCAAELSDTARKLSEAGLASCGTTLCPRGSIVVSTRAPIGYVAVSTVDLCTNQGCRTLVSATANSCFHYYQLLAAKAELESWGQGSTFLELSKTKLEAIPLASPPETERRAIADFLDRETARIDALIE